MDFTRHIESPQENFHRKDTRLDFPSRSHLHLRQVSFLRGEKLPSPVFGRGAGGEGYAIAISFATISNVGGFSSVFFTLHNSAERTSAS